MENLSLQNNIGFVDGDIEAFSSFWKNLRTLNLNRCKSISDMGIQLIAKECQSLTCLKINGLQKLSDFGIQHLANNTKLRELHLSACIQLTPLALKYISNHEKLHFLNIGQCMKMFQSELGYTYLRECRNITRLSLSFLPIKDYKIGEILESLVNLEELSISWCPSITDFGMKEIALHSNKLQILDISHTKRISDKVISIF